MKVRSPTSHSKKYKLKLQWQVNIMKSPGKGSTSGIPRKLCRQPINPSFLVAIGAQGKSNGIEMRNKLALYSDAYIQISYFICITIYNILLC